MKRLFDRLKSNLRMPQFTAVSIYADGIREKAYLRIGNSSELIDVSLVQSPFCLKPLIIGVKIKQGLINDEKSFELIFSPCFPPVEKISSKFFSSFINPRSNLTPTINGTRQNGE